MLVDARWPPPDPEPAPHRRIPWAALAWPVLTIAFLVLGNFVPPLAVFFCVIAALYCFVETFLHVVPLSRGLRDYRQ